MRYTLIPLEENAITYSKKEVRFHFNVFDRKGVNINNTFNLDSPFNYFTLNLDGEDYPNLSQELGKTSNYDIVTSLYFSIPKVDITTEEPHALFSVYRIGSRQVGVAIFDSPAMLAYNRDVPEKEIELSPPIARVDKLNKLWRLDIDPLKEMIEPTVEGIDRLEETWGKGHKVYQQNEVSDNTFLEQRANLQILNSYIENNYQENSTYVDVDPIFDRKILEIPQINTLSYTAEMQSPVTIDKAPPYIRGNTTNLNFDPTLIAIGGTIQAMDVGTYQIMFGLKDKKKTQWSDGSTDDKTLNWIIGESDLIKMNVLADNSDIESQYSDILLTNSIYRNSIGGQICNIVLTTILKSPTTVLESILSDFSADGITISSNYTYSTAFYYRYVISNITTNERKIDVTSNIPGFKIGDNTNIVEKTHNFHKYEFYDDEWHGHQVGETGIVGCDITLPNKKRTTYEDNIKGRKIDNYFYNIFDKFGTYLISLYVDSIVVSTQRSGANVSYVYKTYKGPFYIIPGGCYGKKINILDIPRASNIVLDESKLQDVYIQFDTGDY